MRRLLFFTGALFFSFAVTMNGQETIAGWTFPTGVDTVDVMPDLGLEANSGHDLFACDTTSWPDTQQRDVYFTDGVDENDFAATAINWDEGNGVKQWNIKIKADGYADLKVSSIQRSDAAGPKDWKIQAQTGDTEWIDIPGGEAITVADDWTTGIAENLELPDDFDNPGTSSIYIRWIMTSNTSVDGNDVTAEGISKIENIMVTGTYTNGAEEVLFGQAVSVYPNPVSGNFITISSNEKIEKASIYSINGQLMNEVKNPEEKIDIRNLEPGVYFIRSEYRNSQVTQKLVVQ